MIKIGTPRQWHVPPSVTLSEAKDLAGAETLRFAQGDKRGQRCLGGLPGFGCENSSSGTYYDTPSQANAVVS
jgi:hypothetical protein